MRKIILTFSRLWVNNQTHQWTGFISTLMVRLFSTLFCIFQTEFHMTFTQIIMEERMIWSFTSEESWLLNKTQTSFQSICHSLWVLLTVTTCHWMLTDKLLFNRRHSKLSIKRSLKRFWIWFNKFLNGMILMKKNMKKILSINLKKKNCKLWLKRNFKRKSKNIENKCLIRTNKDMKSFIRNLVRLSN